MKTFLKIAIIAFLAFFIASATNLEGFGWAFFLTLAILTALVVPARLRNQSLYAGIDMEIWKKYIIEKFRKDNAFMFASKDDSGFVLGGSVVHIPQAGASPVVVKNRNSYPAVAVRRTDTDITYVLDSYTTDPTHIPFIETQTISYKKLDSVLGDHMSTLGETIADDLLIKWAPAATEFVRTTGAAVGPITGQTGNRKGFSPKELKKAMILMNTKNVPKAGRRALIDDNMYEFFYDSLTDSQANAFNQFANEKEGIVGRLHGFDIYTRSSVVAYSSANAVKALDSVLAAADNLASLCWHPRTVCRAVGEMKPFQEKDNPLYYGDLYSMLVRMGGRKERADNVGVIAIVQDASA
ncbi:MAG: hypothetical protein KAF40_01230 [Flavihumibacter sp.]|nr:hypothetical protein [Flavihumibacter sp.]